MNETQNQNSYQESDRKAGGKNIKGSALDRFSLPVWVVGGALALVILLMVISGWKIVNSEREKWEIERSAHLLTELPILESKWQKLEKKVKELEGNKIAKELDLNLIKVDKASVEKMRNDAKAEMGSWNSKAQMAKDELSEANSNIINAQNELKSLNSKVDALTYDEKKLVERTDNLRNEKTNLENMVATLKADITGLNREISLLKKDKERNIQYIKQMTQDEKELKNLSDGIKAIADDADKAIKSLQGNTQNLNEAVIGINDQKQLLIAEGQIFNYEIKKLKTAVDNINEASTSANRAKDKIEDAAENAETQAGLIQATLAGPLKALNNNAKDVSIASESLITSINKIESNEKILQEKIKALSSHLLDFKNSKKVMDSLIDSLSSPDANLSRARSELAIEIEEVSNLVGQTEVQIRSHPKILDETFQNIESKLIGLGEKIKDLDGLLQKSIKANKITQEPNKNNITHTKAGE